MTKKLYCKNCGKKIERCCLWCPKIGYHHSDEEMVGDHYCNNGETYAEPKEDKTEKEDK